MKVDIFNTSKKYNIIYADPAWSYNDKCQMVGGHGQINGADHFYQTMSVDDICKLPVKNICEDNCILFMWVTMPFLNHAEKVMNSWGFKYKTCGFTWIKTTSKGKIHHGMGHYTMSNAELCLIGIKGKSLTRLSRSVSQIIMSEVRSHSQKPDEVRDKIVEIYGNVSKIELFARQSAEGWDCWGNEAPDD